MKQKTSEKIELNASKRTVFGKKLKALRNKGLIPGNIYGEAVESEAVEFPLKEFFHVYKKSGETQIVYMNVGNAKEIPVLIQHVQTHPVTDKILHIDLRRVNLKKKIETHVPIEYINESEAIAQDKGILLTLTEEILIEALPEDIPTSIKVDISVLKELNEEIKVKDIKVTGNFTFIDEPEKVLIRISEHKEEEIAPQIVSPESVEITTGKKDEEEEVPVESEEKEKTSTE